MPSQPVSQCSVRTLQHVHVCWGGLPARDLQARRRIGESLLVAEVSPSARGKVVFLGKVGMCR